MRATWHVRLALLGFKKFWLPERKLELTGLCFNQLFTRIKLLLTIVLHGLQEKWMPNYVLLCGIKELTLLEVVRQFFVNQRKGFGPYAHPSCSGISVVKYPT